MSTMDVIETDEDILGLLFDDGDATEANFQLIEHSQPTNSLFKSISDEDIDSFLETNVNKNTKKKTDSDLRAFTRYLENLQEFRQVEAIPPGELSRFICGFLITVTKKDGDVYEPTTLRAFFSSIDRYLRSKQYGFSLMTSTEFARCREVLKAKQKSVKALGKGNKTKAADPLDEEIINQFLDCKTLGDYNPESLLHSLWLLCTTHFGMRTGTETYNLKWGDIEKKEDENGEYLEFKIERQTKTRTGADPSNTRLSKPRAYATTDPQRDPIHLYNVYRSKRPSEMLTPDSPFFLSVAQKEPKPLQQWYKKQAMGVNKLYNIMNDMKKSANITTDKRITPYSARKHLIQKLTDQGVPSNQIVQISGHRNVNSLNNYSKINPEQSKKISDILSNTENKVSKYTDTPKRTFLETELANDEISKSVNLPSVSSCFQHVPMLANNTFNGSVNFHFGQMYTNTQHTEFSQSRNYQCVSPVKHWKRIRTLSSSDSE